MQRIDPRQLDTMELKLAETASELEQSYRILHDVYMESGIVRPDPRGVRILPQFLLPTTWTMIASDRGRVVATSTLIGDSELGLPAEDTHPEVMGPLRQRGERIMESTGLACLPAYRDSGLVYVLLGATYEVMRQTGMTKMLMRLSPRAAPLYQEAFACESLAEARELPGLPGRMYAMLALDIASGEAAIRRR
ncbi:MAG: hypothetical protein H7138_06795, partial [Myxococcales bacterium]|nr:hypothetical protein [Myxococcales bacterium]